MYDSFAQDSGALRRPSKGGRPERNDADSAKGRVLPDSARWTQKRARHAVPRGQRIVTRKDEERELWS